MRRLIRVFSAACLLAGTLVTTSLTVDSVRNPADAATSNVGRDYWAVDTDNCCGGRGDAFAIAVANNGANPAAVKITEAGATVASATVAPNSLKTFELPRHIVTGTTQQTQGVYHVTSDQDIVAYQFNPLRMVFTNDASLLLPTPALGTSYRISSYRSTLGGATFGSFGTIVASAPGSTKVQFTTTAPTQANASKGIGALGAGATLTRTLSQGEALQVEADTNGDLTGSQVLSDKPVSVIGGAGCVFVPSGSFACDHLEEQMFPTTTWGKQVPVCRAPEPSGTTDLVRIMAQQDDTQVSTTPATPGFPKTLAAGQYAEVLAGNNLVVSSTKPILINQYLQGNSVTGKGDPSMLQMVPAEQFQSSYRFLVPDGYSENDVVITAPTGTAVSVDGTAVPASAFAAIGNTGLSCATVKLPQPGAHTVSGNRPVGIAVYGFEGFGSYAYPGGLQLQDIASCERGFKVLQGTALDGVASKTIKTQLVPVIAGVNAGVAAQISAVNCDVVAKVVEQTVVDPITDQLGPIPPTGAP